MTRSLPPDLSEPLRGSSHFGSVGTEAQGAARSILLLLAWSMVATWFARLPLRYGLPHPELFYLDNAPALATLPLAAYLATMRRSPSAETMPGTFVAVVLIVLANTVPTYEPNTVALARIHMPIALWGLVALAYGTLRDRGRRVAFVVFTGDVVLLTGVLLCGGIVVSVVSMRLFDMLYATDLTQLYLHYVVVWGAVAAPLVAAHLAGGPKPLSFVGRVAMPFLPILALTLLALLVALDRAGLAPLGDSSFLASLNAMLVCVAFVSLAIICDRTRRRERRGTDAINLALIAMTLAINALALGAIVLRLCDFGYDPVRVAVFGTDAVVFVLFAGLLAHYARFVAARAPLDSVTGWIASYLPILPAWALLVALVLPFAEPSPGPAFFR